MYKTKWNHYNDSLFYILLFFGLFDTARNYTLLPDWIGYLKDIAIFLLYILNLKKIKFLPQKIIYLQCIFWLVWGLTGIVYSGGYSPIRIIIGIIKYLEFFMLITLFSNWANLFSMDIDQALSKYIKGSMCIFIINVIGYFIPNPICYVGLSNGNVRAGLYGGRISVGQPAIAALPMLFSCVYLMFCEKNNFIRILYLIAGIVLSTTNTGMVALGICGVIYVVYAVYSRKKVNKKYLIGLIIILGLLFVFRKQLYLIFQEQIKMYERKIIKILQGGKDASLEKRKEHWEYAVNTLQTVTQWIFGRGMYGFCADGEFHLIENTYISLLCTYGILGLGIFLVYLVGIGCRYIKGFLENNSELYLFGICLILIYLLHMYTHDNLTVYTMTFAFSFFYALINKRIEDSYSEKL